MKRLGVLIVVFVMILLITGQPMADDENTFSVRSLCGNLTFSGLLEVEAGFSKDFNDVDTSDITLATMALGIDAEITEWCAGHVLFLWEEDETEPVDMDEGFITLESKNQYSVFLSVGKLYVPFGIFETVMISDPFTLEISETRESALMTGGKYKNIYGALYAFNGDIRKKSNDENDEIRTYGINAGYSFENDTTCINIGAGWISNIMDSDGLGDGFEGARSEYMDANPDGIFELDDYVAGYNVYAVIHMGFVCLIGEYIGAADDPEVDTDDGAGAIEIITNDKPGAFHLESSAAIELMNKDVTLGVTYQSTDNLAGEFPESRYGVLARIALADAVQTAVEYMHDLDYDEDDGGTGDTADTLTFQLAVEF